MNYHQVEKYLGSFINHEKCLNFSYSDLKIERVKLLFKHLDIFCEKLNIVHIAGTKGKGSTAHICACLIASSGHKAGLYTSPHIFDFRERIKIAYGLRSTDCSYKLRNRGLKKKIISEMISKNDVVEIVGKIKKKIKKIKFSKTLGMPTFFELYTAIALKYFLNKELEFAVLETGLGGRLDATNIVNPRVSVITHVGYDHTDKLGKRLSDIALEKTGIIKNGIPVISAKQRSSVEKIIVCQSRRNNAPLFIYGRDFKSSNIVIKNNFTLFDFQFQGKKIKNLQIKLKGEHQIENACCALAATHLLNKSGIIKQRIRERQGLSEVTLEGRFEIFKKKPLVVMDIAHNCSSFLTLQNSLDVYFPKKKIILVFACSQDKDPVAMLKLIRYDSIVITKFHNSRAQSPENIRSKCRIKQAFIANDVKESFSVAGKIADKDSLILISGSVFLVSEAKRILARCNI